LDYTHNQEDITTDSSRDAMIASQAGKIWEGFIKKRSENISRFFDETLENLKIRDGSCF
jgi:hypothetical protein